MPLLFNFKIRCKDTVFYLFIKIFFLIFLVVSNICIIFAEILFPDLSENLMGTSVLWLGHFF